MASNVKPTKAQSRMLRSLNGEKLEDWEKPRSRWQQELTVRALLDRGWITTVGWNLTPAGLEALREVEDR